MGLTDFLAILDIVVTILFGVIVTHLFSVRDSRVRALKDYYIKELSDIKTTVAGFYSSFFKGEYDSNSIIGWYSSIRNRVDNVDLSARQTFSLHLPSISRKLFVNYKHITGTDEFNSDFTKEKIGFKTRTKIIIGNEAKEFYDLIDRTIYDVNNSGSPDYLKRKLKEFGSHFNYYRENKKQNKVLSGVFTLRDWFVSHLSRILGCLVIVALVFVLLNSASRILKNGRFDYSNRMGESNQENVTLLKTGDHSKLQNAIDISGQFQDTTTVITNNTTNDEGARLRIKDNE